MAKVGDKIYFGKLVNAEVDMAWVAGVVAETRNDAIDRIKANIDPKEMELYYLIKVRCTNPAVKELDICYYYSDYFKDVFKYFDIDYMHAYNSFFGFMINFIMQEEIVE